MSGGGILAGFLGIVGAAVLLGYGGWEASRSGFRQPSGWPRMLASGVLAWIWLTLGLQALGALGLLNRPAILVHCALGAALAAFIRRRGVSDGDPGGGPWTWDRPTVISLGLTLAVTFHLAATAFLTPPRIVSDGPIYHLFFAAKWWKAGRVFLVASPFGESAATYFPANGDLLFAGLMALCGGDRAARIGQAPFFLMSGLAAYGIARRLGASSSSSLIAVGLFLTSMPLLLFSFEANVDTLFVAGYLASVAFGLRYLLDGRDPRNLVLAGLAAGGAWGTKPTATAFLPPVLLLIAAAILFGSGTRRTKFLAMATLLTTTLAPCGFWFGQSLWLTGNPLYPMHLEVFGRVVLRGWYGPDAMRRSQFYLPAEDWRSLLGIVFMVADARAIPFWSVALLGGFWKGRLDRIGRVAALISLLAILNVAIFWLAIPYRTQQRFMLQGLGLAAAPLALWLDRGRPWRWLAVAILAVHIFTPQNWPWTAFRPGTKAPWELSPKIPTSAAAILPVPLSPEELRAFWMVPGGATLMSAVAVAVAVGLISALAWSSAAARPTLRRNLGACVVVLTAFTLVGGAAVWSSRASIDRIYPTFGDYQRGWLALERFSPPEGTRVAYAGTNLPYYLMAGGLRNDVFYVNIHGPADWLMHDFHRTAADRNEPPLWDTPRPGWDRLFRDYPAWLENLRERDIRLLVVARANWMDGRFNIADDEQFPIERAWADDHPELFTRVYPTSEPDPLMRIYRLRGKSSESGTDRGARRP